MSGEALASQYQVICYSPAVGESFVACPGVTRAGMRQVFAHAELCALKDGIEKLVSRGSAVLMIQ